MKFLYVWLLCCSFSIATYAQFTTVTYDQSRAWFNDGQPLPAEAAMIVKSNVDSDVEMVEFNILSPKREDVLYQSSWQRQNNGEVSITLPYPLRAAERYDFKINFYEDLSDRDRKELVKHLQQTMNTYVEVNLKGSKDLDLRKNSKKTLKEMQEVTDVVLSPYRTKRGYWQSSYSEVVRLKLEQLDNADLDDQYSMQDTSLTKEARRVKNRNRLIEELQTQIDQEVEQLLNTDVLVLTNSQFIDDYPTDKKRNMLSLNIGYSGIYLDGGWEDLDYAASPYVGLAFPLGNSVLGAKVLRNTSVTMGIFLQELENTQGEVVEGFLIDRPLYLGLDHKLFQFIRINAGATFLQEGVDSKNVLVRPYMGLSARVDLGVRLGQ
ncbi:MAG: hypothetical protein AAGI23_15070 [Bacteroidota bacterium]